MAYNFGQFLSTNVNDYLTPISNYTIRDLITQWGDDQGATFTDKKIEYQMDSPISGNVCYYLKFKIKKMRDIYREDEDTHQQVLELPGEQNITIRLGHSSTGDKDTQTLKAIYVPKTTSREDEYVEFDLIIAPNDNYDEIRFILTRIGSYDQREITLEVINFSRIINIISSLQGVSSLKQIGVQGPQGLQMCIDGESIKIGRTGIYEINHGYTISFLGFIYPEGWTKPFILDYQY